MEIPIHEDEAAGLIGHTLPGTRLEIVESLGHTPYGDLFRAMDTSGPRRTAAGLLLIRPDLLAPTRALERLRAEVTLAGKLDHKNLVRTVGMGQSGDRTYVLTESVSGRTLRALLAERAAPGRAPYTLQTAYNVVAHLANALGHAHGLTAHGGISPSNVIVNKAGRVQLAGFGLARALPAAHLLGGDERDRSAVAPELAKSPDKIDLRADIYALGAILFELLTGRPPSERARKPSAVAPGLPGELDGIVARCLALSPLDRYPDAGKLKAALAAVVAAAGGGVRATSVSSTSSSPVDEREERWLVRKGKLDHGPFHLAAIKAQVDKDEIVPGDCLVDKDSHSVIPVEEHPFLHDLVAAAAQRRDDYRRAHAEAVVVKQEKRKGLALYLFLAAGALAIGGGVYLVVVVLKGGGGPRQEQHVALLGGTEIKGLKMGGAKRLDDKAKVRRPGGPGRAPGKAGDPGYDDSQSMDMGGPDDVGDERLDDGQINGVLGKHASSLGGCLVEEARRGGSRHADIEFIIQGSGKVSSVRVNGETGTALASCIRGRMQALQFPPFNGTRTRASFDMGL